ncbi:MAG TPA: FtsQ-type POTRA domain-containing protein [Longilinea sp.]|nr:FtsQ-type POTRA domain-containing protein [Longilinea sp.]
MSQPTTATQTHSRSNQVRQRRTQETQTRLEHVTKRSKTAANSQPLVMRGSAATVRGARPVHQSARGNVRRQYYYNLEASGVEVRLPSMPMVNPGWRLASGLLVAVMLIGIFVMLSGSMFEVSSLKMSGLQRLSASDIETALKIDGTAALDLNTENVKAQVAALFPELTDIQVKIGLPAKIEIRVRERQPVVAWQMPEQTVWIDPEGVLIPARGEVAGLVTLQADGLPELTPSTTASAGSAKADGTTAADLLAALKTPSTTGEGSVMNIHLLSAALKLSGQVPEGTTLAYSTSDGLGWMDTRGWKVFIGNDLNQLDTRLAEYETIVQQLTERGITPVMISVEHLNAPFFRTE